jgi:hypothetical protein
MKPTAPLAQQVQRACQDTLPWLISVSLDASATLTRLDAIPEVPHRRHSGHGFSTLRRRNLLL